MEGREEELSALKRLARKINPAFEVNLKTKFQRIDGRSLCLVDKCAYNQSLDELKDPKDFAKHLLQEHKTHALTALYRVVIVITHNETKDPSPDSDTSPLIRLVERLTHENWTERSIVHLVCLLGSCNFEKSVESSIPPHQGMLNHLQLVHEREEEYQQDKKKVKTIKIIIVYKELDEVIKHYKRVKSQTDFHSEQVPKKRPVAEAQDEHERPRKQKKTEIPTGSSKPTKQFAKRDKDEQPRRRERAETITTGPTSGTKPFGHRSESEAFYGRPKAKAILKCSSCDCRFQVLRNCRDHPKEGEYKCGQCKRPSGPALQAPSATRQKLSQCPICKEVCDVDEHLRTVHEVREIEYFTCLLCGEKIPDDKELHEHMTKYHPFYIPPS